jgi:hypothetical protein
MHSGVAAHLKSPKSPFPELTDTQFKLFVELWGDESLARKELTAPYGVLGGDSAISYLRRCRRRGIAGWCVRRIVWLFDQTSAFDLVYQEHCRNRAGVYS